MIKKKTLVVLATATLVLASHKVKAQTDDDKRQHRKPPSLEKIFRHLDADEDGKISEEEAKGPLKKDFAKIDFAKPHAPLLFIAGEKDHIIPKELNKKNFEAYKDPNSVRGFKEFKDRGHFICGDRNWEEVATYAYNWLN